MEHGRPEPDCLDSNLGPTTVTWASYFKLSVPQFPYLQNGAHENTKFIGLLTMMTCVTTVHVRHPAQCLAQPVATTGVKAVVLLRKAAAAWGWRGDGGGQGPPVGCVCTWLTPWVMATLWNRSPLPLPSCSLICASCQSLWPWTL